MAPRTDPPGKPPPDKKRTASGLDESQLDPSDLEALRKAVVLKHFPLEAQAAMRQPAAWRVASLDAAALHAVSVAIGEARPLKLRIAPLPTRTKLRKLPLPPLRATMRSDLEAALRQPVRRPRILPETLPRPLYKELHRQLYAKYGEQARELIIAAVFPQVPPEVAPTLKVQHELDFAVFRVPEGVSAARLQKDCYLVILRAPGGETRNVILRLGE